MPQCKRFAKMNVHSDMRGGNMKKKINLFLSSILALTLIGCSNRGKYKAGTYEGVGKGRNGEIKVSVTV